MTHSYHEIAFTPMVLEFQKEAGSKDGYAEMAKAARYADVMTSREMNFLRQRDSFYMSSVSETGWPYVQHRGGSAGFIKILDDRTIGFADYTGNRQYISLGNLVRDNRVSLFFMDYPNKRRLKMFGRVELITRSDDSRMEVLKDPEQSGVSERGFVITVEGFDWNCPAYITPRFSKQEAIQLARAELGSDDRRLQQSVSLNSKLSVFGDGPLKLTISGIRQLTPSIRAYELRDPDGKDLPAVTPGAHLSVPILMPSGEVSERSYSIASNTKRRNVYEIAVQRDDNGSGGSRSLHASYQLGSLLHVNQPQNHFPLHQDDRPAVLIAGGIGITPIKPMAQQLLDRGARFSVHYAGQNGSKMAFADRLQSLLKDRLNIYRSDKGERIDFRRLLRKLDPQTIVYICGPNRMIAGLLAAADKENFARSRISFEVFA